MSDVHSKDNADVSRITSPAVLQGLVLLQRQEIAELASALRDCALVINGMHADKLPPCFKPTLEMVNSVNFLVHKHGA